MLYLKNTTEAQVLFIPKPEDRGTEPLKLKVHHTIELTDLEWDVTDIHTSTHYFRVGIELPEEVASGEWEYTLTSGNTILSQGLLFIGNESNPYKEMDIDITYKEYGN